VTQCTLIGATTFFPNAASEVMNNFKTDADGGQALVEAAGRGCYDSYHKPNPATDTNRSYLKHILEVRHFSVVEHALATFLFTDVSRSLTHELVRHRHFSYSQLSQRYKDERKRGVEPVIPPELKGDEEWQQKARGAVERAYHYGLEGYDQITSLLKENRPELPHKEIRQVARAVLPNATETKIVVTGNMRSWREFLEKRGAQAADREIRELAVKVYEALAELYPNLVQDFKLTQFEDGTWGVIRDV
jgi:thymidylate synthase (FAD)